MPGNSHDDTLLPFLSAFFKPINTQDFSNLGIFKVYVVQGFHAQLQEPL